MSETEIPSQTSWDIDPSQPEASNGRIQPSVQESIQSTPRADDSLTFRRSHVYALLLPLTFIVGLSVGYLFWGRATPATSATNIPAMEAAAVTNPSGNQANTAAQTTPAAAAQDQEIVRYDVPIDDDPYYGPENAAITIIEFSDFECPYCRKWHAEVFQRLLDTYPGQIKFVYRDFPLTSIHPNAFGAAEAANCAGEQGVYWPYHEQLFSMQLGLGTDAYKQYAEQLGVNMETFNSCLDTEKYKDEIQADFEFAAQLGVRSTPTFFINGIALVGAQPFETFQQVIDKELAGEIP